ncbi:MAG: AAA family ATPase [Paramuribaculum sp.]|nr:AAA family ATPase [Paramuribaculum sp.]MDE6303714.1 AAA family ATPase [Paramuribaculum sp.]
MAQHPFIESLQVKSLGLFDDLKVDFTPGLNIIIGPNASGKTSLLRAITFCFNSLPLSKMKYSPEASFGITVNKGDDSTFMAGYDGFTKGNDTYQGGDINVGKSFPAPSYNPLSGQVPYNLLAIGAHRYFDYEAIKFMKREDEQSQAKYIYDQRNSVQIDKPTLPSIKQWMINRYFQIDKPWAEIEKANWDNIMGNLSQIAPDGYSFSLKEIGRDLEPKFELDGNVCYLEELSSGFKSILAIVFSIVQWIELVNEGEKRLIENAEGTVLIDEIDSHLHLSWQATIAPALSKLFPSLQFIITTHSPLVMSTVRNDDINSIQKLVYIKDQGFRGEKIYTYGNDASSIISGTLNSVPRDIPSDNQFSILFEMIDNEQYPQAFDKLSELKEIYGAIPELAKAESMLAFLAPDDDND